MPARLGNLLKSTMGNVKSKRKDKNEKSSNKDGKKKSSISNDFSTDIFDEYLEDPDFKMLRRTLEHNPEIFVLNNLMMSVQFFENFDEEIASYKEAPVSVRESELNSCLPAQKHALIPDVLQEHVAKKVNFVYPRHDIFCIEPLQPIRVFIVYDNIEVTEQNYASPYSSMNEAMTYSMQLKQSEHKGYAMLQRLEVNPSKKKIDRNNDEAIYSDNSESVYSLSKSTPDISTVQHQDKKKSSGSGSSSLQDEDIIVYDYRDNLYGYTNGGKNYQKLTANIESGLSIKTKEIKSLLDSPAESTSSGYRSGNYQLDSDSDGSYAQSGIYSSSKITLDDNNGGGILNFEIPKDCFTFIAEEKIYTGRKERRQRLDHKERLIKGVLYNRNYGVLCLNSIKFMNYFYDFFTRELSESMGFNSDDQEPDGAIIYRDKLEILDPPIYMKDDHFAITPCIWSAWPSAAHEWLERPRGSWPSFDVIEKIREIGCNIIPEGYYTEKINNDLQNFEWELIFPAAERYLETCMLHSQIRVYMISLLIQKTFFRPIQSVIGLTGSHIRNQLFWLIEEDDRPTKWPEYRTGECLLKLLNSLYKSISQDIPILPDYFIRDKNLFQGKIYLLRTQKQLKRIIENPIMYILHAMQYIKHSKKIFPKFDYGKLLKILTEDVLILINPQLVSKNISKSLPKLNDIEKDYEQTTGFWETEKQTKEKSRIYGRRPVTNRTLIDAETSYDQVIEIAVRCAEMESRRISLLLEFFIHHFINIAEYYHKYRAISQKNLYIEHTQRLVVLLSHITCNKDEAKIYMDKLKAMKEKATGTRPQNHAPETPKRNCDPPLFTATLNDRYKYSVESQSTLINSSTESEKLLPPVTNEFLVTKKIDVSPVKKHVTMAIVHEDESEIESSELQYLDKNKIELPIIVSLRKSSDVNSDETTYI